MTGSNEDYDALRFYTLAQSDPAFLHQHVVDAQCAQTADETTKPIAVAFALIGLYLRVEKGCTGRDVQRVHMRLAKRRRHWPRFQLPDRRGLVTVADVAVASPGSERDDMVHKWCVSVWDAWSESRDRVIALLRECGIES
jgi:hypothetical protein